MKKSSFNSNFSFNISTNWGNEKTDKNGRMSPQTEYWLNRILRDHGWQIFIVTVLTLVVTLTTIILAGTGGGVAITNIIKLEF